MLPGRADLATQALCAFALALAKAQTRPNGLFLLLLCVYMAKLKMFTPEGARVGGSGALRTFWHPTRR